MNPGKPLPSTIKALKLLGKFNLKVYRTAFVVDVVAKKSGAGKSTIYRLIKQLKEKNHGNL